jgi:hypothetical protein
MRALTPEETAALASRRLRARNLVWITAKDRVTEAAQSIGFWDDVGTVSMQVRDALAGLVVARTFIGAGGLLGVEDVPLTSDLAIHEVSLTLSQIDATVAQTVRGYDPRLGPIQVYRGLFNPDTHALVAPARCRFVGFVDAIDIVDPSDKREGRIEIRAVSQLREMTRSNPSMGSDEDQKARSSGDRFFRYAGAVSEWSVAWGQDKIKIKGKGK